MKVICPSCGDDNTKQIEEDLFVCNECNEEFEEGFNPDDAWSEMSYERGGGESSEDYAERMQDLENYTDNL